eukprot:CAMPEP_0202852568 /NCGR_PEP_ID=MMETSP1389-20130828/89446_1 /ASSEMBLY_ACC=CAM_ASM_000865 /TAXON_ID=302021 /ORGANISM="Rhodomonas sp., Strain CCMP768" /LENGTH=63 /DNA_ID=CAMNT_0049531043 /DNA_START=121 /DNA_END=309 /DNA_ORIENTATION=+
MPLSRTTEAPPYRRLSPVPLELACLRRRRLAHDVELDAGVPLQPLDQHPPEPHRRRHHTSPAG